MIAIFIQSSISKLPLPYIEFDLADKIVHFIIFGLLGILVARGLRLINNEWIRTHYFSLTIIACILYGASDEIHQYFVPGRHSSLYDWIADILGILVMVWIYKVLIDKKN